MGWRMSESLEVLRRQLNEAFPNRSKASDGGIGDAKHASRSSDHNPHVQYKGQGIVTARDFTHDPDDGIDCNWLAKILVKNRDSRIKYLIWNRQICSSKTSPWKWRPYSGSNAHTKHLHISVLGEPKQFDSVAPWDLDLEDDVARIVDDEEGENFNDLKTGDLLDLPISTAASPLSQPTALTGTQNVEQRVEPAIPAAVETPSEFTATKQTDTPTGTETVEVTKKNEQDVNTPAQVAAPEPYMGVGFWGIIKRDLGFATGGNLSFTGISEYAQQASGWPEWVIGLIGKVAIGALIATACYFIFRVIHFCVDTWKKNQKTKMEVDAKTSVVRKDIDWT